MRIIRGLHSKIKKIPEICDEARQIFHHKGQFKILYEDCADYVAGFYTKLNVWDSTLNMIRVPSLKIGVPSFYISFNFGR